MRRKIAALAATMLVAGGLTAVAVEPAAAGACTMTVTMYYNYDIATTLRTGGTCSLVAVRHFAVPMNGGTGYYTNWFFGYSTAQTTVARELRSAQGGYVS